MRIIIYGTGAVGGTIAGLLADAGHEVIGISRGAQLAAIRDGGLKVRTVAGARDTQFEVVEGPDDIDYRPDDAICLTMKGQDCEPALAALRRAGVTEQPIFCFQNGVENERRVLRRFANVHGVTVMMPCDFIIPGEVAVFGTPCPGMFDIGLYTGGHDAADAALVAALNDAGFAAFTADDVMASKYGKLLMNLGNIVEAALGPDDTDDIRAALKAEGQSAMQAAGIAWQDVGLSDPRRKDRMQIGEIPGVTRVGSSSTQSLARATGSIETEFLNGEIELLGRLHGVPTPGNAWFTALATRILRDGLAAGSVPVADARAALGL
ncbi:ketopantoate reductase family protein [Mesobaculum littorinae]|uniref:Ketopantoate reductase family protein n=1 Tax=Mesobaculum littorinae TaxID=2486419 RepID=A0A438AEG4_9RHOB|nr:2-dehydropantoate 2-reductase N-terminal domain-containing protein [Mesobaculum littorinae]RVV97067.1 ketopantoate reductase family protein [Mesobaculum littorinae]